MIFLSVMVWGNIKTVKKSPPLDANSLFIYENLLADFSFREIDAKEKFIKKKSTEYGGATPPPCKLLKKLAQNFSHGVHKTFELSRYARLLLSLEMLIAPSCKRSRLSRDLPVPIATQDTASFATLVLIPVTCVTSWSKP